MIADNLMMQSVNITVIGMTIVFTFLLILVCIVFVLGALNQWAEKYFPQETAADDTALAVAIAAAKRFQGR